MYMLLEMCCVCLANTNNLKHIDILDIDNIKIVRKLEYCTTKCKKTRPAMPSYICLKCCQELRTAYEFKKSYYRSCKLLKGYVSQLKRDKNCYNNNNKKLQQELRVKITNLGECMIDGTFSRDLVEIENVETQFVDIVPESDTSEIVAESDTSEIVTNIENTDTDQMVNNLVEENISLEYSNEHLDIDEVKIFADSVKSEEIAVDNPADTNILEEKEDTCKIWVENKNGNTFLNFASSIMQQSVEIIQDVNVLDNEVSNYCSNDGEIDKSQLNLVLEGIAKTEDTGDICKIWVENTSNTRLANNTDSVSSISVIESANIKQEIIGPDNTNTIDTVSSTIVLNESENIKEEIAVPNNTANAHVKRNRKRMKYSHLLTDSSCDNMEINNNITKCMHCNKAFTYKIDLLNFLITHSCNKPFCSTFCREQYDKMCSLCK